VILQLYKDLDIKHIWGVNMTHKTKQHLKMMKDIYTVSSELGIKTFVWGGYAVDILHGELTREHSDLDCFTENLVENLDALKEKYEARGYAIGFYYDDFWMLNIKKGDVHATFNTVRNIGGIAHWHHAGPQGTVFFPYAWLDNEPRLFYSAHVYTFGIEMAYVLKTNVKLVSPEWAQKEPREKDKADILILEQILSSRGICKDDIKKKVWSHNPYWYELGYEEYYFPIRL